MDQAIRAQIRQSAHTVRHRTSYQRPPGSIVTSQDWYKTTNILAFREHADRDGVMRWSDGSLQVLDLKAAVAPLCSGMIVDAHSSSPAAPVDGNHMYHKVTETRSQTSSTYTLSTSHPT